MAAAAPDQALVQLLVSLALVADQVAVGQAMPAAAPEIKTTMEEQAALEPIKVAVEAVAQVLVAGMHRVLHQTMQDLVALVPPGLTVLLVLVVVAVVDIR